MAVGDVVRRADPLVEIAQRDELVYVALPKDVAEQLRRSTVMEIRLVPDDRHPRLRRAVFTIRREQFDPRERQAPTYGNHQPRRRRHRGPRRPPETT